jgi:hypothetical protein
VRPERDPKETHSRPKRDLFATSVATYDIITAYTAGGNLVQNVGTEYEQNRYRMIDKVQNVYRTGTE